MRHGIGLDLSRKLRDFIGRRRAPGLGQLGSSRPSVTQATLCSALASIAAHSTRQSLGRFGASPNFDVASGVSGLHAPVLDDAIGMMTPDEAYGEPTNYGTDI